MESLSKRSISRRELLSAATLLAAGAIASACGAAPTPTPTQVPPTATKPTAAPAQATAAPPPPTATTAPKPTIAPTPAPAAAGPIKMTQWDSNPAPSRTLGYKIAEQNFNKQYPNVTIEYVPVPIANYQEKLTAAIAAGTPPDVADIWFNWMAQYAAMKALLSLEPHFALWARFKDYSPAYLKLARVIDNTAYVLTWDIFQQGTHYRKDLVKAAGLDDPRALDLAGKWDWNAFNTVAKALHKPDQNFYGVSLRGGVGADFTIFNMMIAANKGKWFDDNNNCLLNSAEAVAALAWYSGLHTTLKVTQPSAPSDGFQEFTSLFYKGLAGMMIHNDDGIQGLQSLGRDKYATAQMPAPPGGKMYMGLVGYGYSVMAATKYPEMAARYIFSQVQDNVGNILEADKQLGQTTQIATAAPMISDMQRDILKDPLYDAFYDAPNNHPEYTFTNPFWLPEYAGLTAQIVVPDFQNVLNSKLKPKEAADKWAAEFTKAQQAYAKAKK